MLLYCVPHAGASAMNFLKWKPLLNGSITPVPLELAGRGIKLMQPVYANFPEAVQDLFNDFQKTYDGEPFALYGHSLGGWLVYELYYHIKDKLHVIPRHIFFSSRQPPDVPDEMDEVLRQDSPASARLLIQMINQFQGTETAPLDSETLDHYKNILKSDLMLATNYQYLKKEELIQSPLTVLCGTSDPKITNQQLLRWRMFTINKCTICKIDGNHFFLFNNMKETVSLLNSVLAEP